MTNQIKKVLIITIFAIIFLAGESSAKKFPKRGIGISYYPHVHFAAEKIGVDFNYRYEIAETFMQVGIELNTALSRVGVGDHLDNNKLYETGEFSTKEKNSNALDSSYGASAIAMFGFTSRLLMGVKVDATYLDPKYQEPRKWHAQVAFQFEFDVYKTRKNIIGAVGTVSNNYFQVGLRTFF